MRSFCQRSADWLFSTSPMLRVRSSMAFLAVLLMLGSAGLMLWMANAGYGHVQWIARWAVLAVGGLAVMAAMVRLGITATWRDPALTFPQILWAITASAVAYVLADHGKGVVPGLVAVTLLFAGLNLQATQIVAVGLYAFVAFASAVGWALYRSDGMHLALELGYAASLALMLMGCMLLSLRLYQLRGRLRQQREELADALEENRELASRDPLTGLLNRRHMLELLHLEQRRCLRGVRSMMVAQMDIDHFKAINDTYGHGVGDVALQTFANQVRENIRSSDVFSRWGGEEFVLLLSDTQRDDALQTLERVRVAIQNAVVVGAPAGLKMTVSIGLAAHIAGESVEVTLDRADKALYRAKRAGRNQVVEGERLPSRDSPNATQAQQAEAESV